MMQQTCKYNDVESKRSPRGLTLLELVVVLAILVVLSGMLVPIISGLGHQANSSTNATLVSEVDRAVRSFHARGTEFNSYPDNWDSLLNTDGNLFSKLHPAVSGVNSALNGPRLVEATALTALQAASLKDAGIHHLYTASESQGGSPSLNQVTPAVSLTTGTKVALLDKTPAASNVSKLHFKTDIKQPLGIDEDSEKYDFVVLGLGLNSQLRGQTIVDIPLVQSADPTHNYARVLCIFMVPGTGSEAVAFPAKYIGSFLPDGTSLRNNVDLYNNSALSN